MTGRLLTAGAVLAVLFVALGLWVKHHSLSRLDADGESVLRGDSPLAVALTQTGYGSILTALGVATIAGALALRVSPRLALAIGASQLASQVAVTILKRLFDRARPAAWLYRHEPGFSYPSGHATTAVVFYGAWLIVLWNSALPGPVRGAGTMLLAAWALGIGWSRVALGAHYVTDVAGGLLFGGAWLCIVIALAACSGAGFAGHRA